MQLNKEKSQAMIDAEYETKKKRNKSLKKSDIEPTFTANIPLALSHPLRIIFEWVDMKMKKAAKRAAEEEDDEE